MHKCKESTIDKVNELYTVHGSWRKLAKALGYNENFAPTLCHIGDEKTGAIDRTGEDQLRNRLGLTEDNAAPEAVKLSGIVLQRLIKGFQVELPIDDARLRVYKVIVEALDLEGWHQHMECLGLDSAYDAAVTELYPHGLPEV